MADEALPVTADEQSASNSAVVATSDIELPDRIRVHALAKLLGVTSKNVLTKLKERGAKAGSAQSALDRETAEAIRDQFAAESGEAPAAAAVGDAVAEPVHSATTELDKTSEEPIADDASGDEASGEGGNTGTDDASDGTEDAAPRRRRRGRRGRGRGRSDRDAESGDESAESSQESDESSEAGGSATAPADADTDGDSSDSDRENADSADEAEGSESASRRRRRRRRRKTGGNSEDSEATTDDPPNTVVHEREPRAKSSRKDEVQGISGSTRLEAKRQRRREGRDSGRRRPPILTEAEFLARRESVDRVMVIREKDFPEHPGMTQVAVLEDRVLVEHFVTSAKSASLVGNVYLGRVQNVLPSMEAAFVDIGRGRNGVLYAGEVNWEAAGLGGKERKIEQALNPGDTVVVQVTKDPVGQKGARLTTQISLAGRFLVYVPGGGSTGISRKLPDTERRRLKDILRDLVPADAGVIIRTASEGVSAEELTADIERLQGTWQEIEQASAAATADKSNAPKALYEEPDLLLKVVRDLFNEDFAKLVIEGERAWNTVEGYIRSVAPDLVERVQRHDNSQGLGVFDAYRIDEQLAKALDRKVWLPSGGTLVIDRTEAMTVVDVNTGKFTGTGGNLEETVTRNNLEAAEEIVRQMRLRDIGGMIIVDFIDMVLESNRELVLRRLTEALGRDRTRHQVSEVTSLGLVQMTRKRLGTGLIEAFSTNCEHCHGRGIIIHPYPVDVPAGDDSAPRREAPTRRRRRGAAAGAESDEAKAVDSSAPVDPSARRAHPVALAMAAHAHDDEAASEQEAHIDESAEQAGESSVPPEAPQASAAEAAAPEPDASVVEPTPSRPRRRRVSRGAAAPTAEAEGAVFVIAAGESGDDETVDYAAMAASVEVPAVRRRPRRRATSRPAGGATE